MDFDYRYVPVIGDPIVTFLEKEAFMSCPLYGTNFSAKGCPVLQGSSFALVLLLPTGIPHDSVTMVARQMLMCGCGCVHANKSREHTHTHTF